MTKETRNEKFRRLAENRMTRVLQNMDLISNLTNKQRYEYSEKEIKEMYEGYIKKGEYIKKYFEEQPLNEKPDISEFIFLSEPIGNDKNNSFRRIGENRMTKIFKDMNLIANLSVKTNYKYSVKEVEELFNVYFEKGIGVRERFLPTSEFKFNNQ